jgi:hypothetical protein
VGCADVTIVAIAAITAFVILILILSRADFAAVFENFGRNNTPIAAAVAQTSPVAKSATPRLATPTPTPPPPSPTPTTPAPKKVVLKQNCNLRPEPSVNKGTKGEFKAGAPFILLGNQREAENIRWINVEVDDGSKNQGWMWDTCFDITT